jgi:hypothetical protein
MKKSIFFSILLLSTKVIPSCAQGYVVFSSYAANNDEGVITTFDGLPVSGSWTAELYFALGAASDPVGFVLPSGAFTAIPSSITSYDANGDGYFQNNNIIIVPGYTSGPITFEVVAFKGSSYANSGLRGRSGSFTMESIANNLSDQAPVLGENGQPMPDIVISMPEPTTLTLAGLGGLVSLVAFRRKQA